MIHKSDSNLTFGTFKGSSLKEVFLGSESTQNIDQYLKEYLTLFYDKGSRVVTCLPDFYKGRKPELFEKDKKLILSISENVAIDYVQCAILESISKGTIPLSGEDGHKLLLGHWIQNTLSTEYSSRFKYLASRVEDAKFSDLSSMSRLLFSNTSYIIWAINNIESFVVDPNWLEEDHILSDLSYFEIIEPNLYDKSEILIEGSNLIVEGIGPLTRDCSIVCKPIFKKSSFKVPINVAKFNRSKYDKLSKKTNSSTYSEYRGNYHKSVDFHNPWNDVLGSEEADLAYWNTN